LAGEAILIGLYAWKLCRNWRDRAWRTSGIILLSMLPLGQLFNVYTQPHEPQVQINVMLILPVAWAAASTYRIVSFGRHAVLRGLVIGGLSVLPLWFNMHEFSKLRGMDSKYLKYVEEMESRFPPEKTVFVEFSNDGTIPWRAVQWDFDTSNQEFRMPAPQPIPKYKFIILSEEATQSKSRTPEQSVARVKGSIDTALDSGYTVIACCGWEWKAEKMVDAFSSISDPAKPLALHKMLHDNYDGTPVYTYPSDPPVPQTPYHELKRKQP